MKYFLALLTALSLFSQYACHPNINTALAKVEQKAYPHDAFTIQRSFPDRDFDWKGWQKALQRTRQAAQLKERNSDCSGTQADWTLQGPSNVAGRVNSLALKPDNQLTLLAGFSAGGIFKTTDGGVNWRPVFDNFLELSIGYITFDPSNPNVVYAGTGDANMPSYVFNGSGLFKSTDAGETWQYLGLEQAGIISKIVVHPTQPQVLFVATMGNPYVRDAERGVYKSVDGGQTWQQLLFVSNQAGASDLVMDPSDPQVLYASFWDRIRNNSESVIYGNNARVYKTTNGGANWTQLGNGLPTTKMGRTALAISRQNPLKVYALFTDTLSKVGGIYRSLDGGATWNTFSIAGLQSAYANFGWYFGKIILNPNNDEEVYVPGVQMWRKTGLSNSWFNIGGGHSDMHDIVFLSSGRRYTANDGGVYYQDAGNNGWTKCNNLPLTQFYRVGYNPHQPNMYFGGAQDNGTVKGNALNLNGWQTEYGSDGFRIAFNADSANVFWAETQNGGIHKTSDGGQTWQVGQDCLGTADRCNWDTPYMVSRHNPNKLYAGTYRMFSREGALWTPISTDLTDGNIYGPQFHTISAVEESPVLAGKLFAGTSDANVWRKEPTGNWVNISAGLPNRYVTSVQGSPTVATRIFVTHSGFRDNEYIPHVHRSNNNGQTWTDISGDLPQIPVNDLFILPGYADSLLFVATDAGVYFSKNSGVNWNRLGERMPYVPVFDLDHNIARKQLIAGSYARGLWTFPLDSVLIPAQGGIIALSGDMGSIGSISIETPQQTIETEVDGTFEFPAVPGCQEYTLMPYRNDNPVNGVTTFDLALISKHILGLQPLDTPYKIIAADANKSGAITTFDIVVLRKLILGIDTVFTGNTSWRFVPAEFVFPDPLNPFTSPFPENLTVNAANLPLDGLDFVAIKTGDVNDSAAPTLTAAAEERTQPLPILLEEQAFEIGNSVVTTLSADLKNITALQFTLQFDPEQLVFEKMTPLANGLSAEHFSMLNAEKGIITFSFDREGAMLGSATESLFELQFHAKKKGTLSGAVRISDMPTPALAFKTDGVAMRPLLLSKPENGRSFVVPNPFGQSGCWLYYPEIGDGLFELQITDTQGKLIHKEDISGSGSTFLPSEIFPLAGTWLYRIVNKRTAKSVFTGKLAYGG